MTLVNETISHYRIISQLGAGGMGEVYLAQDMSELERTVALKILPAGVASNAQRMQRFIQEARTVSALNHPNILTIHEIGEAEGTRFIVTEYIDGVTLREHLRAGRVKLHEVLDIAMQVAAALDAAHDANIVHRDIKPENIMVRRRDQIVKVLDFGLAKLADRERDAALGRQGEEEPTMTLSSRPMVSPPLTLPGLVMGTVSYMSPEQSQGAAGVDHRTDIWSLGVVLYEMVAGLLPFGGKDIHRQIIAIQESEPLALSRHAGGVPVRLEEIVEKALAKSADERYQSAKDLLIDLRNLKRKLEVDAEIERTVPAELRSTASALKYSTSPTTVAPSEAPMATGGQAQQTSNAEYLVGQVKRYKRSAVVALVALVLAVAGGTYFLFSRHSAQELNSLAVLPFVNASNDPNTEYLSDGISETLINSLSQLQRLRVTARSTAFRYKGKDADPHQVGGELNVQSVLMGRVRQEGDTVNIQVDLVDATTGAQIWGEEYNRKASDILAVKQDIARAITEKLRLKLTSEERQQLARHETANAEAYQFYLRGRYYWSKRTGEGIKKAIEQFQQAIDRDPNYGLGYVGLADCYVLQEYYAGVPASETLPRARAAADRALQIDDSLAEAHAASAHVHKNLWHWAEAEHEYQRAVSLKPNYPTAHQYLGVYFSIRRQFDEALKEMKRALELDPLSPIISDSVTYAYVLKNDLNSAIEQGRKTIELDPTYPGVHDKLGWAYLRQRRYEEATTEFQKAVELSERASINLMDLGYCYAITGRRAEALVILNELQEKNARREAIGQFIAGVYAGLGDKDRAFGWLEKDFEQRSGLLPEITYRLTFEDLRSDPRYADLVRRMALQP